MEEVIIYGANAIGFLPEAPPTPSGWLYQDIPLHNSPISYEDYDDGYNQAAGLLQNPANSYPEHIARLDLSHAEPFFNLDDINQFGNQKRFTDENGLQVFGNGLLIDHLYNRAYTTSYTSLKLYNQHLIDAEAFSLLGINSWRCLNVNEQYSLFNFGILNNRSAMAYPPFNFSVGNFVMSTLTSPQSNGSSLKWNAPVVVFGGISSATKLTNSCVALYVTNYYI